MFQPIKTSIENCRAAVDCAPFPTLLTDSMGKVLVTNEFAVKLFGYSREKLLGQPSEILISEQSRSSFAAYRVQFNKVSSVADLRPKEFLGLHRDGHEFPIEIALNIVETDNGLLVFCAVTDITERKKAEQAIVTGNERLRILHQIDLALIAGESPAAIAATALPHLRDLLGVGRAIVNLIDLETGEVEWLAAAGRRRVRSVGSSIFAPIFGRCGKLKSASLNCWMSTRADGPEVDALRPGIPTYMVVPMIAGGELIGGLSFGGGTEPFSADTIRIAQEAAAQFAIALTQARLHERVLRQAKELEARLQALRESEDLFRNAFEHTNVPMALTGIDHQFVRVNSAFAQLLGYSQAELLQKSMVEITHPECRGASYLRREELKSGTVPSFQMEKRYLHKDGRTIWGLLNLSLIRDSHGEPLQYFGQVQDITDRKRTERWRDGPSRH